MACPKAKETDQTFKGIGPVVEVTAASKFPARKPPLRPKGAEFDNPGHRPIGATVGSRLFHVLREKHAVGSKCCQIKLAHAGRRPGLSNHAPSGQKAGAVMTETQMRPRLLIPIGDG